MRVESELVISKLIPALGGCDKEISKLPLLPWFKVTDDVLNVRSLNSSVTVIVLLAPWRTLTVILVLIASSFADVT